MWRKRFSTLSGHSGFVIMVQNCCVVGCSNRCSKDTKFSFHSFPRKDPPRMREWIQRISRQTPDGKPWMPGKFDKVCSAHFQPSDFCAGMGYKTLSSSAVPSIFPEYPARKVCYPVHRQCYSTRKQCSPAPKPRRRKQQSPKRIEPSLDYTTLISEDLSPVISAGSSTSSSENLSAVVPAGSATSNFETPSAVPPAGSTTSSFEDSSAVASVSSSTSDFENHSAVVPAGSATSVLENMSAVALASSGTSSSENCSAKVSVEEHSYCASMEEELERMKKKLADTQSKLRKKTEEIKNLNAKLSSLSSCQRLIKREIDSSNS